MILVPQDKVELFSKEINKFKAIQPIKIESPNAYILPESILEDIEIITALPELLELELINENNIVFMNSEF